MEITPEVLEALLAGTGESQRLEFKERIGKEQLAKEIAAFATSNDGWILIGVADDGSVTGVDPARFAEQRDLIYSLARDAVKPNPMLTISLCRVETKYVIGIYVRQGDQPIYYAHGRPTYRQGTLATIAEPDLVRARILHHDALSRAATLSQEGGGANIVAGGIIGQGELATKNFADVAAWMAKRERRRLIQHRKAR